MKTPALVKNGTLAVIDWTKSFALNGRLREYLLRADNILMVRGLDTVYGVQRTSKDGGEICFACLCLSVCLGRSICLPAFLSVCLSVCLSVSP